MNIISVENEKELVNININGEAKDDTELIVSAIKTLILQIEVDDSSIVEKERFNTEMKNVLLTIAEKYGSVGWIDHLSEEEKVYNKIEEQYEITEKGKVNILQGILQSFKLAEPVL